MIKQFNSHMELNCIYTQSNKCTIQLHGEYCIILILVFIHDIFYFYIYYYILQLSKYLIFYILYYKYTYFSKRSEPTKYMITTNFQDLTCFEHGFKFLFYCVLNSYAHRPIYFARPSYSELLGWWSSTTFYPPDSGQHLTFTCYVFQRF